MIRTNLSTRPFYNERAVHAALAVIGVIVLVLSVFNATRIVSLSRQHTELTSRAQRDEQRARELRSEASTILRGINPKELDDVSAAAREANALIDRRIFSWTELFNRFEATLPPDVRITAIRPKIDRDGRTVISLMVVGRRVEDIDRFIENLEGTGAFADLLSLEERMTESGLLQTKIEGRYVPGGAPAVAQAAGRP